MKKYFVLCLVALFCSCDKQEASVDESSANVEKSSSASIAAKSSTDDVSLAGEGVDIPKKYLELQEAHEKMLQLQEKRAKIKTRHGVNSQEYRDIHEKFVKAFARFDMLLQSVPPKIREISKIVAAAQAERDQHI